MTRRAAPGPDASPDGGRGLRRAAAPWAPLSRLLLLAGLLAHALAAPASAQPADRQDPVELRLRTTEGETLTYRHDTRLQVTPPPGMGQQTLVKSTVVLSRTTRSVRGDTLRYAAEIDDFRLEMDAGQERMNRQLETMADSAREAAVGRRFELVMTTDGRLLTVAVDDDGRLGADQLRQSLRRLQFAVLPEGPVEVGESWSYRTTSASSAFGLPVAGEVVVEHTGTLEGLTRREGSLVADLQMEASLAFRADSAAAVQVQMEGTGARNIRFDVERGLYLSSSGAQDFTIQLSVPGARGTQTIRGEAESTTRLVRTSTG